MQCLHDAPLRVCAIESEVVERFKKNRMGKTHIGREPMNLRRVSLVFAGVAAMLCLSGASALAQSKYPNRPVRIIVPFAARRRHRCLRARARQGVRDPHRRRRRGREPGLGPTRSSQPTPARPPRQMAIRLPPDPQHGLDQSGNLPETLVRTAQGFRACHQRFLRAADCDPQQERARSRRCPSWSSTPKRTPTAQLRFDALAVTRISSWNG